MQLLEVGKQYPGNYRQEGNYLDYNENGFTLYYFMSNITPTEAEGFKRGKYKFALTLMSDILFFLSEFKPGLNLSDTPFHFGLYKDNRIEYLPKEIAEGEGLSLQIVAVDSTTGIVKALRMIGLSTKFSQKLIDICIEQSKQNVDEEKFGADLFRIQHSYTAKKLYNYSIVECKGV